jgi:hypothetical protein
VLEVDDDRPVGQVMTLSEAVADSLATQRFSVLLVQTTREHVARGRDRRGVCAVHRLQDRRLVADAREALALRGRRVDDVAMALGLQREDPLDVAGAADKGRIRCSRGSKPISRCDAAGLRCNSCRLDLSLLRICLLQVRAARSPSVTFSVAKPLTSLGSFT